MSRRNQILSVLVFSSVLLLALLFRPRNQQPKTNNYQLGEYSHVVAIELGEQSRVGVMKGGKPRVIFDDQGHSYIPSCVNDTCILRPYFKQSIAVDIIKRLKTSAEDYLGEDINYSVIGVPAYFNDTERQFVKDSATIAGLTALRIINEPTAACLAYELGKTDDELNFLVYHLSSQSSDVSIVRVDGGVFEILAHASGSFGSDDFHQAELGQHITKDIIRFQALTAEELLMSGKASAKVHHSLTRCDIDTVYKNIFDKEAQPLIQGVLQKAHMKPEEFEGIILTGIPQHVAKIQSFIENYFNTTVYKGIRSDETILHGLARQADFISPEREECCWDPLQVAGLSIGIDDGGVFIPIITRHSVVPTRKSITVTTIKDSQSAIKIDILQGERPLSSQNHQLDTLEFPIQIAKAGVPKVDIVFDVDANEILAVVISEKGRGKETKIVVGHILRDYKMEEIEALLVDAETNHDSDMEAKKTFERREFDQGFNVVESVSTLSLEEKGGHDALVDEGWFGWFVWPW